MVSMKEPCRTKVNSWESYSRHVICSHIVDGRPSTGETIDDRISEFLTEPTKTVY